MVGWHPQFNEHEFEQAPGVGDGQGSLVCCSPQGHKELDTTEQTELNWWRRKGELLMNGYRAEVLQGEKNSWGLVAQSVYVLTTTDMET